MTEAPKKKMSKGCLIGIVILGIAVVVTVLTVVYGPGMLKDKILRDAKALEVKVKSLNPPGYTDEQIHSLFAGVITAFETGTMSPDALRDATQTLAGIASIDSLTVDDAVKVLEALRTLGPNADKNDSTGDDAITDTSMSPADSTVGESDEGAE